MIEFILELLFKIFSLFGGKKRAIEISPVFKACIVVFLFVIFVLTLSFG